MNEAFMTVVVVETLYGHFSRTLATFYVSDPPEWLLTSDGNIDDPRLLRLLSDHVPQGIKAATYFQPVLTCKLEQGAKHRPGCSV